MSAPSPDIWSAYISARNEFPKISKESQAYAGKYANLATILSAIEPILNKHGFQITNIITQSAEGATNLVTEIYHSPSTKTLPMKSVIPINFKQEPQQIGSALTYLRRYALLTILNLCPIDKEDDDGEVASPKNIQKMKTENNYRNQPTGGGFPHEKRIPGR